MIRVLTQGEPSWGMPEWVSFDQPREVLATSDIHAVPDLLRRVEREADAGRWCAGFVSYEAAAAFDSALETHPPEPHPLAWFAVFDSWRASALPTSDVSPLRLAPDLREADYAERVARIKACIARGETYQVNFTFPLRGRDSTAPLARFARLMWAQRCRYGAFIETPEFSICSASPELFFQREGGRVTCRPMKGTARRGRRAEEDAEIAARLAASPKERAENIMIVDMMRNDLGRIARPGSVRVDRLFEVERLPTVWQMTSTVSAATDAGLAEIFGALFPCASVTGAPKVQTMRIIRALEGGPRGVYTGAIGIVAPDRRARFSVAIRTLVMTPDGAARYDVGSGVVWDSEPAREYAECLAKARVLEEDADFELISTLRWEPDIGCALWPRHATRLRRSAEHFGRPFDEMRARSALEAASRQFAPGPRRVRLRVDSSGGIAIEDASLPSAHPMRIALATAPLDIDSPFVFHKTTRRAFYDAARATRPDVDDVLLWNPAGEITETTIANVAFRRNERWVTPPIRCGLLGGVMREELLARGAWSEGVVRRDEIAAGETIQLANAVRGCWEATLVA